MSLNAAKAEALLAEAERDLPAINWSCYVTKNNGYAVLVDDINPWLPPLVLCAILIADQPMLRLTLRESVEIDFYNVDDVMSHLSVIQKES